MWGAVALPALRLPALPWKSCGGYLLPLLLPVAGLLVQLVPV